MVLEFRLLSVLLLSIFSVRASTLDSLEIDGECERDASCALNAMQVRGTAVRSDTEEKVSANSGWCDPGLIPGPRGYCYKNRCAGAKAVMWTMKACSAYSRCVIHLEEEAKVREAGSLDADGVEANVVKVEDGTTQCPPGFPYYEGGRCFRNLCSSNYADIYTMATNCRFYTSCVIG
mmetsp:Transcript_120244/g.169197  ORF Transcript_120244/g.169197 Transcript_120244/m.169197 type:complete len:177 (+) Transcript_120244:70-600(+)